MGLLEFLFEHRNPHPVGTVDVEPPERSGSYLVLRAVIAAATLAGWSWFLWSAASTGTGLLVGVLLSLGYLVAAYWLQPAPEMSNLGLWGTVIDHPFRLSDDLNRMLLFLYAFLWPGRFIAATLIDLIDAFVSRPAG